MRLCEYLHAETVEPRREVRPRVLLRRIAELRDA